MSNKITYRVCDVVAALNNFPSTRAQQLTVFVRVAGRELPINGWVVSEENGCPVLTINENASDD